MVSVSHLRARGTVDDHAVRHVIRLYVTDEFGQVERFAGFGPAFRPMIKIQRCFLQQHALGTGNSADPQIQIERAQAIDLRRHLRQQFAADGARSDQSDGKRIGRQIKSGVHRAQRLGGGFAADHHGDIAFRGALGNCPDADGRIAQ